MTRRSTTSGWSWVWALLPALTLGFTNPGVALYAAIHTRTRIWWGSFAAYAVTFVVLFSIVGAEDDTVQSSAAGTLAIANWVIGAGHALATRRKVFGRPVPLVSDSANEAAVGRALHDRQQRDEARAILARDPRLASDLGIGRPDLGRGYDDGGLVDLNTAPAHVFGPALGLDEATALRVVAAREATAGFTSVEEMLVLAGLPTAVADRHGERIVLSPRS